MNFTWILSRIKPQIEQNNLNLRFTGAINILEGYEIGSNTKRNVDRYI